MSITRRQQIAEIRGAPIYVVTDVALLPLATRAEAIHAIKQVSDNLKQQPTAHDDSHDETSEEEHNNHEVDQADTYDRGTQKTDSSSPASDSPLAAKLIKHGTSVAEDVIGRKGAYGRFAENWFSKQGWSVERRRTQGMSAAQGKKDTHDESETATKKFASEKGHDVNTSPGNKARSPGFSDQDRTATLTLLPKLLRSTRMLLTSRSFFFSYDHDITRKFGGPNTDDPYLPLCKSVDPLVRKRISSFFVGENFGVHIPKLHVKLGFLPLR